MASKKIYLKGILITIITSFIVYYLALPPLNLTSPAFWLYLCFTGVVFFVTTSFSSLFNNFKPKTIKKIGIIPSITIVVFLLISLLNFALSPLFKSKLYAERITIDETKEFTEDIKQVNFNSLPLLDKDSSRKLGDRVMGQLPELVSQFYVSDLYTQVNYQNEILRVTPLEYAGFFKYLANRKEGIAGYITVNSVTGESKLIKLDTGMKYMPSAIFNEDLTRKLRFNHPREIFGNYYFEIDEEGKPYWVIQTIKYIGVGIKKEISGVIVLDPVTGESTKYSADKVPVWLDHVYASDLIIEQVNDWGKYKNGFINSIIGQKNVVMATEGYNYTVMNDDLYLYTGITSVSTDEANIGFILTNLRTKETNFYAAPGAEEYSAMASAEGQVQQMKYKATFPLLINLNNKPTYLISLKDNAGLVKMYAFVDVIDYQKVVVTDAALGIEDAANKFLGDAKIITDNKLDKEIKISTITNAVIDNNTYYYITDNNNQRYIVSIKVNRNLLPFLKINQKIKIEFTEEKDLIEIISIKEL